MKKTDYSAKTSEIESKIPGNSGLATNAALTPIKSDLQNKIPDVSSLVKLTGYNTKTSEI